MVSSTQPYEARIDRSQVTYTRILSGKGQDRKAKWPSPYQDQLAVEAINQKTSRPISAAVNEKSTAKEITAVLIQVSLCAHESAVICQTGIDEEKLPEPNILYGSHWENCHVSSAPYPLKKGARHGARALGQEVIFFAHLLCRGSLRMALRLAIRSSCSSISSSALM
jgi:hypothetical protein